MMENNNEDCDDIKENMNVLPDLIELVKFVQENPLLWNQSHPDFKNRDKKDIKWISLGSRLTNQLSGDEAKKRFCNLRTTFGKLYKKVCDGNKLYKPDWPLYEHMLFLRDFIRPRKSKKRGIRKIKQNFILPKIPKRRMIIAKTHTVQPIFSLAPSTNSTIQLVKNNICETENNVNTSQHLPQNLSPEELMVAAEGICSQPNNLKCNDSWTETTDTESDPLQTSTPDKSHKKRKNNEALLKIIREMVGVLKSLTNSSTETLIVRPSSSNYALSPTAEALLAFVRASLNKVKEENLVNCFQDVLNLFQKYIEK